jgi:hypothetical protein
LAGPEKGAAAGQVPLLVAPVAESRQLLEDAENHNSAEQYIVIRDLFRVEEDDERGDAALVRQARSLGIPRVPCRERHDGLEQDWASRGERGYLERKLPRRVGAV